jgi:hypothetical protein
MDDSLRQKITHSITADGLIGREYVIEGAVFTDDYDHMLDWSPGFVIGVGTWPAPAECRERN